MNYIKSLQKINQDLQDEINRKDEIIKDLLSYLNMPKFNCGNELDNYVNTQDVRNRLVNFF